MRPIVDCTTKLRDDPHASSAGHMVEALLVNLHVHRHHTPARTDLLRSLPSLRAKTDELEHCVHLDVVADLAPKSHSS
eukprot:5127988-Amphidinium_carterae.2